MSSVVVIISGCHGQVLVARGAVQELQRGAEGHEGARDRLAGRVGRRRRCPRHLVVAKETTLAMSTAQRAVVVSAAVLCFAASRWLSKFIEENFFQDYSHAYK